MTHRSTLRGRVRAGVFALLAGVALTALAAPAMAQTPTQQARPGIGITGFTAPDGQGAGISTVLPGYGADEAGLRPGDVITAIEGTQVESIEQLAEELSGYDTGDRVSLTFERDGDERMVDVALEPIPSASEDGIFPPFLDPDRFGDEPDSGNGDRPADGESAEYLPVLLMFGILITGFLATLTILKVLDRKRDRKREQRDGQGDLEAAAAKAGSSPIEVARMRYARGELTREQFQTISADLGGEPSDQVTEPSGDEPSGETATPSGDTTDDRSTDEEDRTE